MNKPASRRDSSAPTPTKPGRVAAATSGGEELLEAAQEIEREQQAALEAAPIEQTYQEALDVYVQAKFAQVEHIEDDLDKDYRHNLSGSIRNPLSGLSASELSRQVDVFCSKYGFDDEIEVFQKAAAVAQNPDAFDSILSLTEDGKYYLRREVTRTNKHHPLSSDQYTSADV